eukprot:GILI01008703.1.p1 GENE.GILI01008703.1~~GILI01008703.1.p1  ORF type:complete len:244 (+),score=46.26 GILI01008703.1:101-832(+)
MLRNLYRDENSRHEGKRVSEISRRMNSTNYNIGRDDWQQPWRTVKQDELRDYGVKPEPRQRKDPNYSQVVTGTDYAPPSVHYSSMTKASFPAPPAGSQPARPARDKQSLSATNYQLGTDAPELKSHTQRHFLPREVAEQQDPRTSMYSRHIKPRTQIVGYNIVNGQAKTMTDHNVYEAFNETKTAKRISQDRPLSIPDGHALNHSNAHIVRKKSAPEPFALKQERPPLTTLIALRPPTPSKKS